MAFDSKPTTTEPIGYGQNWEDIQPIRHGLKIEEGDNVFSIAGSGDNVMALLLDNPSRVVALDLCFPQLALCELKFQAVKTLTRDEMCDFIRFPRGGVFATPETRLDIYKKLRSQLSEGCQLFWDANQQAIRDGLLHCGISEKMLFGNFSKKMLPNAHTQEEVDTFLSKSDVKEQVKFYEESWNTPKWQQIICMFSQPIKKRISERPGIYPEGYDLSLVIKNNVDFLLRNVPLSTNHLFEFFLRGENKGANGAPMYLLPENYEIVKQRIDKIKLYQGDLLAFLKHFKTTGEELFNELSLSNISDFLTTDEHHELVRAAVAVAKPGGRVLYWSFLGEHRDWPKDLLHKLNVDSGLDEELKRHSRSPVAGGPVIASVKKSLNISLTGR